MHTKKDSRANYAVCICGLYVTAGSVAVIHFFHYIFGMGKMAVIFPIPRIFWPCGSTGVLWGPSEFILDPMRQFFDVISLRTALRTKYELLVLAPPRNGTTFFKPYNMQLLEEFLQMNEITLRDMHYKTDIRANYAICIRGQ